MSDKRLIYICSNDKGVPLYNELKRYYLNSYYVEASYGSLPQRALLLSLSRFFKFSLNIWGKASLDMWLRGKIEKRVKLEVSRLKLDGNNHVLFWFPLFPIRPKWRSYGKVAAITDVAMDEAYFDGFGVPTGKAREFRREYWTLNFENCDHVLTYSKWAAEANGRFYPLGAAKINNIGWGSNITPLPASEIFASHRENRILCIGHDFFRKGIDIYNEVSQRLKERIANLECAVIGDSQNTLDSTTLSNLTISPPASPQQVELMMKTSKLFMLFSRFDPSPHVIVEAMSHGLPVICSNVCGMAEPIVEGKTGYSCSINDIENIVDKAYDLLTNNEKLERFGREAYQCAIHAWQLNHVAERVLNILRQ